MKTANQLESQTITSCASVAAPGRFASVLSALWAPIASGLTKVGVNRRRELRLCETLSLGEKRIVAIIECDEQRFLVAATPHNVSLLQALGPSQSDPAQEKSDR